MKVLFVVHSFRKFSGYEIGIMYLSSVLKERGFYTDLVEANYKTIKNAIKKKNFKVVAFSTYSESYKHWSRIASKIKEDFPHILVLLGGYHATLQPEIIKIEGVDGVCIGEAEYALAELLERYRENAPVKEVNNFWIKENKKIYKNPLRPPLSNLDDLPFPDRNLYNRHAFPPDCDNQPMLVSRGCFYNCTFCVNPVIKNLYKLSSNKSINKVRRRSVDSVIEELKKVKSNYQPVRITFYDSLFPIWDLKWLREFTSKYKKYINLPFYCKVRFNFINHENVKMMKAAGCKSVGLGIETGNESIRRNILKKNISNRQIINASNIIKSNGIRLSVSNIGGIPGTSLKNDFETLKFNLKVKPDTSRLFLFEPFPQTELTQKAMKWGFFEKMASYGYFPTKKYYYERHLIKNLSSLFPFSVQISILLNFMNLLIRLPLRLFYQILFSLNNLLINLISIWIRQKLSFKRRFNKSLLYIAKFNME